jgi:ornithine cyclodeaminase/alanine dehydrogenase-like protein (mu-crystallin family)
MSSKPLWITEADVVSMMDMGEAIEALGAGLAREFQGQAQNMVKTHVTFGGHDTLHAVGAVFPEDGFVGTKTWAHTEGGATPLLILLDSHDGSLRAVIEAFAMGQLRTAAISGVATRYLAKPQASRMAIIGTGKQAMPQLAAVAAVRRLERVTVFSPSGKHREDFARRAHDELGVDAVAVNSVAAAVDGADLVTLVTRAREPFLGAAMVAQGAHVNAVGAIVPERIEFEPILLKRCAMVAIDNLSQVQELSAEFREFYGPSASPAWATVTPLSRVVGENRHREQASDITLFKAMGMGISDLSLAIELYRRATKRGLGRAFPHPEKVKPRLTSSTRS